MMRYRTEFKLKVVKSQSMSRRANCIDNAVIESFFGTLKAAH